MEQWRAIDGYDGLYEISTDGRVRSLDREVPTKSNVGKFTTRFCKGRVLVPAANGRYLTVSLNNNGVQKTHAIHRLVANTFIPNPNALPYINHKDEDKRNNCVDNLEWCTASYNATYGSLSKRKRERVLGENNPRSKLTEEEVRAIRKLHFNGVSNKTIGLCYGISSDHVYQIITGRRWKHVV